MNLKKNIIFLVICTFLFYILIFVIDTFFLEEKKRDFGDEQYIDKSLEDFSFLGPIAEDDKEKYKELLEDFYKEESKNIIQDSESEKKEEIDIIEKPHKTSYFINVIPETSRFDFLSKIELVQSFLKTSYFFPTIDSLIIELYKKTVDVRGKFHERVIKLFGVGILPKNEFFSVFVHEFGHYIDLYFFVKKKDEDISNYFYDISWDSSKVIKKGQTKKDFVSGYSMTNKYEDFAESFTYYLLHNNDFFAKAEESTILMQKYSFFRKYFVFNYDLKDYRFTLEKERKDYYWDITKISLDEEKFLQFLEK